MDNSLFISPVSISIMVTDRCTAACNNCCFQCKPSNQNRLSYEEIEKYVDQALRKFDTIKLLVITGGECFILGDDLDKIVRYAARRKLLVRVVTNAYWAVTFKKTYLRLFQLKELGLNELNISTGDEHQEWISFDNIIFAIVAAIHLNLNIAINVESSPLSQFGRKNISEDMRLKKYDIFNNRNIHIINGKWVYFKKGVNVELNNSENKSSYRKKNLRCNSLFRDIVITSEHYMYACCGLTCIYIPCLYLGNLKRNDISFLYNRQFDDFIKIWLFVEGPAKILDFIMLKLNREAVDVTNWHICQICAEIFKNPENITCLQNNYQEVLSNVIIKYSLLRQKIRSINNTYN